MSKRPVFWSKTAEQDLDTIFDYILSDRPLVAIDIFQKIHQKVSTLEQFTDQGRIVPELKRHGVLIYRELIISPWRIIYRVLDAKTVILAIFDSRRDIEDTLLTRLINSY